MQLVHGYSRHAQIVQQAAALEVLVTDVERNQRNHQLERAVAQAGKSADDLLQLPAEENSHEQKRPYIEDGTQSIEEEKARGADAGTPRQRRRQGTQAGYEFRSHQP